MAVPGIVEVTNIKCNREDIELQQSRCDKINLHVIAILHQRKPPLLVAGRCQGLIWYSSAIASKGDLGHFEPMDEKDSPTLFVRLAFLAALWGAGLITIYTALARVILWFGLAPN